MSSNQKSSGLKKLSSLVFGIFSPAVVFLSISVASYGGAQFTLDAEDQDFLRGIGDRVKAVSVQLSQLDADYNGYLENLNSWNDEDAWINWEKFSRGFDKQLTSIENEVQKLRSDYYEAQRKMYKLQDDYYKNFDWSNFNWGFTLPSQSFPPPSGFSLFQTEKLGLVLVEEKQEGGVTTRTWLRPPSK